jgi:hypothetical protein
MVLPSSFGFGLSSLFLLSVSMIFGAGSGAGGFFSEEVGGAGGIGALGIYGGFGAGEGGGVEALVNDGGVGGTVLGAGGGVGITGLG